MKLFLLLAIVFLVTVSADSCDKKDKPGSVYKARFEIRAICKNYTIGLIEGKIDTSLISSNWIDENTGTKYKNVFALEDPCRFPDSLKQGDEFYFTIDTATRTQECIVCMAYYPTPPRKLLIKVVDKP